MNPCSWRFFVNLPSENHEIPQDFRAVSMRRNDAPRKPLSWQSSGQNPDLNERFENDPIVFSYGDPASRIRDRDRKSVLPTRAAASARLCTGRFHPGSQIGLLSNGHYAITGCKKVW
jgi:hypothetical protein